MKLPATNITNSLKFLYQESTMIKMSLLTLAMLAFFTSSEAQSLNVKETQNLRTIEVEGNSEMMIIPDEATIHITVHKKAMTVADATKALNAASKQIADAFENSDLTSYDLTANNYFVNINQVYHKGTSKDSGYVASQNLKVRIRDIEKELAMAVEMINLTGDQSIQVNFEISSDMKKKYKNQLLEEALLDAQAKVKRISEIMDLKNPSVHKIQYLSQQGFQPSYQMKTSAMRFDAAESREEPVFMPDEQKIDDRILVVFVFDN
jgi:uncharacterized protein YggE